MGTFTEFHYGWPPGPRTQGCAGSSGCCLCYWVLLDSLCSVIFLCKHTWEANFNFGLKE